MGGTHACTHIHGTPSPKHTTHANTHTLTHTYIHTRARTHAHTHTHTHAHAHTQPPPPPTHRHRHTTRCDRAHLCVEAREDGFVPVDAAVQRWSATASRDTGWDTAQARAARRLSLCTRSARRAATQERGARRENAVAVYEGTEERTTRARSAGGAVSKEAAPQGAKRCRRASCVWRGGGV